MNNPSNNTFPEAWKANSYEIDNNIKIRKKIGRETISYIKNVMRVIADNRDSSTLKLDENARAFKHGDKHRISKELEKLREIVDDESEFEITEFLSEAPHSISKKEIKNIVADADLTALSDYYKSSMKNDFSNNQTPWVAGNCDEMGKIAFAKINQNHPDLNPELIKLNDLDSAGILMKIPTLRNSITDQPYSLTDGPDHTMVVIGRNPDSDITNPHTWNPDAVIVDAWADRTYPVTSIEEEMQLLENVSGHQIQMTDYFDEAVEKFRPVENKE
ncbi:hypothetical protein SAMN04488118_11436 [Epibacterium ulvae]|uniref:Uncharacterized protein n=1 Tax=Epibacterium ulvae TaxID=1156985 RepID=A0A1G5REB3_9RHOB|nr:hypothetical protein SAMN04488118_11436 [Epibacterium ulvae]